MASHPPSGDWRLSLRQAWTHKGWLARILWPLSWLYGFLVRRRLQAYASGSHAPIRLRVPVVVVGNVIAGGVGKTPLVIALVRHGIQSGWKVGVISRGYGRRYADVRVVTPESTATEVGDEPLLIARTTGVPVWVGADRVATAQALLAAHPELHLIISDDGLQHLALGRDLELCVFDERETGNGWLLPAGPLREPWPRTHPHAECIEVQTTDAPEDSPTKHAPNQRLEIRRALADFAYRADGTHRSLWEWQGQPIKALAGIAKPERFFDALQAKGLNLRQCIALPDHDDMLNVHLDFLTRDGKAEDVLCTEKDAVKLWPAYPRVWAVPLKVTLPRELLDRVDALILAAAKAGKFHRA